MERLKCELYGTVMGVLVILLSAGLTVFLSSFATETEFNTICHDDYNNDGKSLCRAFCTNGKFSLSGMMGCHPWLNCYDISHDMPSDANTLLVESVVKNIYLSQWKNNFVILSKVASEDFVLDFTSHILNLEHLSPNPRIVQFVGQCNNSVVITEFHKLGNAYNVQTLLTNSLSKYNTITTRIKLCRDYAAVIKFLHNDIAGGPRVMCDSSSLEKTLTQYLLTDDMGLVLADLDAIPIVNGGLKCGHRELIGDFVAPEQRWPFSNLTFQNDLMPLYDEKSDIWKIPNVCNWFLGNSREAEILKFRLFAIHQSCKNINPSLRPTASQILREYEMLLQELLND